MSSFYPNFPMMSDLLWLTVGVASSVAVRSISL